VGVVGGVEVDYASGRVRTTGGTRFPDWRFRFRWPVSPGDRASEPRRRVAFVQGALVGFTRAALAAGIRFDERIFMFYDEVELGWALADAGFEAWVDLRVPYRHRNRPDSFRALTGYFMQRNRVYLANKRFPLWKRTLFLAWVALVELPAKLVVRTLQGHRAFARACRLGFVDGLARRMGRGRLEDVEAEVA
jgi:GT2 family glycosyltransferase